MCILFARRIRSISSGKGKRGGVFGDWGIGGGWRRMDKGLFLLRRYRY